MGSSSGGEGKVHLGPTQAAAAGVAVVAAALERWTATQRE